MVKLKTFDTILLLILILLVFLWVANPFKQVAKGKADVEIISFDDRVSYKLCKNGTVNAEIWIKNVGDATAYNITCYVRSRNQDGIVLFDGTVHITSKVLRPNETCTGFFYFNLMKNDTKIFHTIEITWNSGRSIHSEMTLIL